MKVKIQDKIIKYHPTAKVACSTGKIELIKLIEDENLDLDFILKNGRIHHKWPTKYFSPEIADYKICFVRDPIERFISGFCDIILRRKVVNETDINNFIKNFEIYQKESTSIKHHFEPQHLYIGTNPNYYTHIFAVENLHKYYEFLNLEFGHNYDQKKWNSTDKEKSESNLDITSENLEFLKTYFKKDYEFIEKATIL